MHNLNLVKLSMEQLVRPCIMQAGAQTAWNESRIEIRAASDITISAASRPTSTMSEDWPEKSWFFQNNGIHVDGKWQGDRTSMDAFFSAGDVVTVELERRHGQDGVMRVRVAGKAFAFVRDMTALPRDGMLYPAVCLGHSKQSYSMVAAP